jgi:DNA polymerase-3 subunit epsilon/ATP-dependent DNA helicase DinG
MTPFGKTFIAIDLETTGLEPEKAQIIEVAAVKFRGGKEVAKFSSLVNPGRKIPFIVTDITGISDEDVAHAPVFEDILKEVKEFIGENPIVGHNVAFDLAFLRANGMDFQSPVFDTWKLSTIAFTGFPSYSLENIAPRLGLDPGSSHRAYDDARLSGNLFLRIGEEILARYPKNVLEDVMQFLRRRDWEAEEVFAELLDHAKNEVATKKEAKKKKVLSKISPKSAQELFSVEHIADYIEGYEKKATQEEIASAIVADLADTKNALFEVAPDSGRILAALAGVFLFASTQKQKTLFATTNFTLRSPSFINDLGFLQASFPELQTSVAKAQESYLCKEQFAAFMRRQDMNDIEIGLVVKIILWLSITKSGDIEELSLLREQKPVARELSFEGCAYHHKNCFAYKARVELESADVVFTDQPTLVKTLSRSEVFKEIKRIVIDEGEDVEESTTRALTQTFSQNSILDFLDTLTRKAPGIGFLERVANETDEKIHILCDETKEAIASTIESAILLFGVLGIGVKKWGKADEETQFTVELPIEPAFFEEREGKNIQSICSTFLEKAKTLQESLSKLDKVLHKQKEEIFYHELTAIGNKLTSITSGLSEVIMHQEKRWVNWAVLKPDGDFLLKKAPLSVATFLQTSIFKDRTAIILAKNVTFQNEAEFIEQRIGVHGFELKRFGQGDVSKCISLTQVTDMPGVTSPKFLAATHEIILQTLTSLKIPALIVVPSYTASKTYYENLKPELDALGFSLFAQGVSGGKQKILEKVAKAKRPVLIASSNFLQGVKKLDAGNRLIFVLKFPFAPSFSALAKAREVEYGSKAFMQYSLPQGLHQFRSLFFYLMNANQDQKKAMVLFDGRIGSARYGDAIMNSLPKHDAKKVTRDEAPTTLNSWFS